MPIFEPNLVEKIFQGRNFVVYRGYLNGDQIERPYLFQVLTVNEARRVDLARLKITYAQIQKIQDAGLVNIVDTIDTDNSGLTLVLEDFAGQPLTHYLNGRSLPLPIFLPIAKQLARTLGTVHQHNIVHGDVRPHNILLNPEPSQAKLTNFGMLSLISREQENLQDAITINEYLPYISPEQTGRMGRVQDFRTDFYSLGITFFQMLTGRLPFQADDPLGLIHAHIARPAPDVRSFQPDIPPVIASIVGKMLAKNADDRYQSGYGLAADLDECQRQWEQKGTIEWFEPGINDVSGRFQILQKLYGRDAETAVLLQTFDRVSQGAAEMLLVTGYAGIGKSALIQEIQKTIIAQNGYFISGKFDQLNRDVPYSAIIQAFQGLIRQILTESEARIQTWREKLNAALGTNGQIIIDVIPEVEQIIGRQTAMTTIGPVETQNRFNLVFQHFITLFAQESHPLVIFWDDLQWVDSASLQLIKTIINNPQAQYLLLIGAYRQNEVGPTHELQLTINELQQDGIKIDRILLTPLSIQDINQLVAEMLHNPIHQVQPLATLIHQKSGGNAFFVKQLLQTLYEQEQLYFDPLNGWQWDMDQIAQMQITDNVIALMIDKIRTLPPETQAVLQIAACIGAQFNIWTLSVVYEKLITETLADLAPATQEGLILLENQRYRFLHTRIQEAAYSMLTIEGKIRWHFKIGRHLVQHTPRAKLSENIFEIVNHLNISAALIKTEAKKEELAQLNLLAGKRAKASAAYVVAHRYFMAALELLPEDSWDRLYDLTLSLYGETAETAYLNAEFELTDQLTNSTLQNAITVTDKLKAYEIKINAAMAQSKLQEAVETGSAVLSLLGIKLPRKPHKIHVLLAFLKTKLLLIGKRTENLAELPETTDAIHLATMRLLTNIGTAAFTTAPELFPLTLLKSIQISIKKGNTSLSPLTYASYGLLLCGVVGDLESGEQFGTLAQKLLDQIDARDYKAKTLMVVNTFIRHWHAPVRDTLPGLLAAYQSGMETGDIDYAGRSAVTRLIYAYYAGQELSTLGKELSEYGETLAHYKQDIPLNTVNLFGQVVLNLTSSVEAPYELKGSVYDEGKMQSVHQEANDITALGNLYISKLILAYLFEDFQNATKFAALTEKYSDGLLGTVNLPVYYFYDSLVQLQQFALNTKKEQKQSLKRIAGNLKKMKKWAEHSPANYRHKYDLALAERCRVLGQQELARTYYEQSIAGANRNQYPQEEALANELAARFYLAQGQEKIAKVYLLDAYTCYKKWGATAKLLALTKIYPHWLASVALDSAQSASSLDESGAQNHAVLNKILDWTAVLKASQSLSQQLNLDRLLSVLMQIVIESAGAQRGFLIFENDGKLFIEAASSMDQTAVTLRSHVPVDSTPLLAAGIVNYVRRTLEPIVLSDASQEGIFTADPYVQASRPRSVLCLPVLKQGQLMALLYLENNLVADAFTPDRLEVLQLLSAQAAISLENARFYDELEHRVAERTTELSQTNIALQQQIQERQRAELALQAYTERLETSNKALEEFAYIASHDLQEPLRKVTAFGSRLQTKYSEALGDKGQDYLARMLNASDRMQILINGLLSYSRVTTKAQPFAQVDLAQTIGEVLSDLELRLEQVGGRVEVGDLPAIEADPLQMRQLLQNLIGNALKFNRPDEPPIVKVYSQRLNGRSGGPDQYQITVADNGIGFDEKYADRIFGVFQRLHGRSAYDGTGIGLAICKKIAERHGGSIIACSTPNQGATFNVTLPSVQPNGAKKA